MEFLERKWLLESSSSLANRSISIGCTFLFQNPRSNSCSSHRSVLGTEHRPRSRLRSKSPFSFLSFLALYFCCLCLALVSSSSYIQWLFFCLAGRIVSQLPALHPVLNPGRRQRALVRSQVDPPSRHFHHPPPLCQPHFHPPMPEVVRQLWHVGRGQQQF